MKVLFRSSLFLIILHLLFAETALYGQWKDMAPLLFNIKFNGGRDSILQGGRGAIFFNDGVIWVGVNALFSSNDTGKTWQRLTFPALETTLIRDICFLDKWHGIIATSDEGVLLTNDGGQTWKTILSTTGDIWKAQFNGSAKIIHALGVDQGICYTTLDGGISWKQSTLGPFVASLAISPDHTVYAFAYQTYKRSTQGWITYSTDLGNTWIKTSGLADGDSYTLSADSCDANKLYLLNEDWASTNNFLSEVFITSDKGTSWQSFDKQSYPYFTGPLATTTHSMYAGTTNDDGIVRSTDKGMTWKSIGGPTTEGDSRTVAAINDNIIFVLDTKGNIWATFNSGNDPVQSISPNPPLRFSSSRIINDSNNITIHLPIYFHHVATQWDVNMILHYRTFSLKFLGTTLYNGKSFDIPAQNSPGRTVLHFTSADLNAAPDSLLGYIDFLWTPLELDCNKLIFDSITTVDPCIANQIQPFKGIIGSNQNCEQLFVSSPVEINTEHIFTLSPNPAGEYVLINSQSFSGNLHIKLYDMAGRFASSFEGMAEPGTPLKININNLSSGVYQMILEGNGVRDEISFVRQ